MNVFTEGGDPTMNVFTEGGGMELEVCARHQVAVPRPRPCPMCAQESRAARRPDSSPSDEPLLRYFAYEHLREPLASASWPFKALAEKLCAQLPRSAERTVMLRKLLEAKDAAVRCAVDVEKAERAS